MSHTKEIHTSEMREALLFHTICLVFSQLDPHSKLKICSNFATGTLWNLSSHDSVKMEIVDHALHALADEVIVPHSGWEKGGGEESSKPRHLEWDTSLTNTAGCLRYWTESGEN